MDEMESLSRRLLIQPRKRETGERLSWQLGAGLQ